MAALTTSNQKVINQGGGLRLCIGQFTSSNGDDVATLTLPGSKIYSGDVYANASTAGDYVTAPYRWSASANVLTVTIAATIAITDGYYSFLTA